MSSAEQSIVTVLQSAVSLFRANLDIFVPDIYGYETTASQQSITTFWSNANNTVLIQEAYAQGPLQIPSWNVYIGADQEIGAERFIGNAAYQVGGVQTQASNFETAYIIGILGNSQDQLRWLQMLCRWCLLYYRQPLETEYGFQNQRVSAGPLQPAPDNLKDSLAFAFMRTVTFTADHTDTWDILTVPTITSATVNITPTYTELGG